MKSQTKGLIAAAAVVSLTGLGVAGANVASAHSGQSGEGQSSLIDALVAKFNLNKSDVQQVFAQQHEARHEQMHAKRLDRLKQALDDKKITQQQYDHIVNAWNEIDSLMEAAGGMKNATDDQRKAIKDKMDELHTWMKEQNITLNLHAMGEMHARHGMRGGDGDEQ